MANDWGVAFSKLAKGAGVGVIAFILSIAMQLDAQCPGATLVVVGVPIGLKVAIDFLANVFKHVSD